MLLVEIGLPFLLRISRSIIPRLLLGQRNSKYQLSQDRHLLQWILVVLFETHQREQGEEQMYRRRGRQQREGQQAHFGQQCCSMW